jgi:hypothetical protein
MRWFPHWPHKDPDETVSYRVDWSDRLGDDTIATSDFTVVSGNVQVVADVDSPTTASVALSGGSEGEVCEILNRITTADGQEMDQTIMLRIRKR